jgi:hypothetical protein
MFGRNSKSYDLNYLRDEMTARSAMNFKKMGFKPNEVPTQAEYFPWEWNDNQALGIGGVPIGNPNQYNRNGVVPDADAVARRLYQPTPSRMTKMLTTDVEVAAIRPNKTLLHPMTVVSEDLQRQKLQRPSRNADVIESVTYENIMPRGMGMVGKEAPRVYSDTDVLRKPIGTNDTGGRDVDGRWENGHSNVNPLISTSLEDLLTLHKDDFKYVQGKDPGFEEDEFKRGEKLLLSQRVPDYNHVDPTAGEYVHDAGGLNVPYAMLPNVY